MKRTGLLALMILTATAGGWWVVSAVWSQDPQPPEDRRDTFAGDRIPKEVKAIPFDSARAMKYLRQLCDLGPRVSGSDAMRRQQKLLKEHFEGLGAGVTLQEFEATQPSRRRPVTMANMIVTWHPESKRRVILCGHYDTRPLADQEPRRADWAKPFASANDGTSTVAWLMELGHHMKDIPTEVGVDFVLFDGEEYIFRDRFHEEPGPVDRYFLGSEHFAEEYRKERPGHTYAAAVLLDLFAGKGAEYPVEDYSWGYARTLVEMVWGIAHERRVEAFRWERGSAVRDDHLALNEAGIPAIDVIDFSYRHWHRLSDTPDQVSPERLAQVAEVLTVWLQRMR